MTSRPAPAGGAEWRPSTSGNRVWWDGEAVVKSFGARLGSFAREHALLDRLGTRATSLPLPHLLPTTQFGELRTAFLEVITGTAAIEAGLAPHVLTAMGTFLRQLHALDPTPWTDVLHGEGPVLAHGDFAHYNVIVVPDTGALLGVVDWEEARRDSPALDLAWCEAQFVARYPQLRSATRHLYAAYGTALDSGLRERALEQRMTELRSRAIASADGDAASASFAMYKCSFDSEAERSAFVAALSRFLASPDGRAFSGPASEALVWHDLAPAPVDAPHVFLSSAALDATIERFQAPNLERQSLSDIPPTCAMLYGAGVIPAWGADDARLRLAAR